jgi:hypothetical protein
MRRTYRRGRLASNRRALNAIPSRPLLDKAVVCSVDPFPRMDLSVPKPPWKPVAPIHPLLPCRSRPTSATSSTLVLIRPRPARPAASPACVSAGATRWGLALWSWYRRVQSQARATSASSLVSLGLLISMPTDTTHSHSTVCVRPPPTGPFTCDEKHMP